MELVCKKTEIVGALEFESPRFGDERGSFSRWYCSEQIGQHIEHLSFKQVNNSINLLAGTVRGLHYQLGPQREYKIVRCIRGRVLDIVVDLRRDSKTFLNKVQVELSEKANNMLIVPPGCAHGFQVLEDDTQLLYCHTAEYLPEYESGVHIHDSTLNIRWPLPITELSERDKSLPHLSENFTGLLL